MPTDEQLHREVIEIVAEIAELEVAEVSPTSELEALGVDSLDGLRIGAAVAKKYEILIDEKIRRGRKNERASVPVPPSA